MAGGIQETVARALLDLTTKVENGDFGLDDEFDAEAFVRVVEDLKFIAY